MNIDIKSIEDRGIAGKERLVLEVFRDDDIGRYIVFDTPRSEDGGVSNEPRRVYWFPDRRVSAGDLVILYTRDGDPKVKRNSDGTSSLFFYWGLEKPIWGGDQEDGYAVLLQVKSWNAQETAV